MAGRRPSAARRAAAGRKQPGPVVDDRAEPSTCWLCGRPLGRKVERHHPHPKSRGGRETEPVHPICHRAIHAAFTNVELARMGAEVAGDQRMARFLAWIADKPPDFHAPTARPTKR